MRKIALVLLMTFVLVLGISCTRDTFVDLRDGVVPATVDLVVGFANQEVRIYCNDQLCYTAVLGSSTPLNGPIAQFETVILRGSTSIAVEWRQASSSAEFRKRAANVTVGDSGRYYLGLVLQSEGLSINIQDTPFYYL
jgi:hypothetical protein